MHFYYVKVRFIIIFVVTIIKTYKVMIGFSAFKRKPKQFNYEPRYYDPKQEERNARKVVLGIPDDHKDGEKKKRYVPGTYIRSQRINRMTTTEDTSKKQTMRVVLIRFIIVMILLILAGYFIVTFNGIEKLLAK